MNICVCDDDAVFLKSFSKMIKEQMEKHQTQAEVTLFDDPSKLEKAFADALPCDILFLDIDMPETNGIDLAARLKKYSVQPYLIFVSTVESLVYESFKVSPFWFIRKRFCESELTEVIEALFKDMELHRSKTVAIQSGKKFFSIQPAEICYVECQGKILNFHYKDPARNISIPYTLSALEAQLLPYGFLRVHKGYLVNYRFIYTIGRQEIILDSRERIPVSKHRLQEVRQEYGRLL